MIQTVNLASFRVATKNKPLKRMYILLGGCSLRQTKNIPKKLFLQYCVLLKLTVLLAIQ